MVPEYKTLTVAPEPFVERAAKVVHSTGDSIVFICYYGRYLESCDGAHRVAPEAASELKVQVEAKFQMYCFILH
jgi:hypothetical protein